MSKRSERKKREEEARRQQEMMRRQMIMMQRASMQQQPMMNNMNYGNMSYGPMSGSNANPCAMPSRFIQLTPIIQPIAMVPYSTQNQPLMMYGDQGSFNGMGGYGDFGGGFGGGYGGGFGEDDFF